MKFSRYIALGDSYSCDKFSGIGLEGAPSRLGAASLFGTYLARTRALVPQLLAEDMAYMTSVVRRQLAKVSATPEPVIVTLTIGQDDLLRAWAENPTDRQMAQATKDLVGLYRTTVFYILKHLPNAFLIGATVADPSDGSGDVPGLFGGTRRPYPWQHIRSFNEGVEEVLSRPPAGASTSCMYLDRLFRDHGERAKGSVFYGPRLWLEPNSQGSAAIADAWCAVVEEAFPAVSARAS